MIGELTPLQQERQEKILQAAARYFAKVHYHMADMDSIAKDAGVGKGTLYRYFKNKDDLYLKTIQYLSLQAFEHLHQKAGNAGSFGEYLEIIIDTAIDYFVERPETFSMVLMSNLARIPSILQVMEESTKSYLESFTKRMEQAIANGEVRPLNPAHVYSTLLATIINAVHSILLRKSGSPQEMKETIKTILLEGLIKNKEQQ